MQMDDKDKLSRILADILHVDCREVTEDMKLARDLDADSLDLAQILLKVERTFDLRVPEEAFGRFKTVQDILVFIRQNREANDDQTQTL